MVRPQHDKLRRSSPSTTAAHPRFGMSFRCSLGHQYPCRLCIAQDQITRDSTARGATTLAHGNRSTLLISQKGQEIITSKKLKVQPKTSPENRKRQREVFLFVKSMMEGWKQQRHRVQLFEQIGCTPCINIACRSIGRPVGSEATIG